MVKYRVVAVIDAVEVDDDGKEIGIIRGIVGPVVQRETDDLTQAMLAVLVGSDEQPELEVIFETSEKVEEDIERGNYKWEKI